MKERRATIQRKTLETDIRLSLDLNGNGEGLIDTGIGFFDHLLDALKKHALFDLTVTAQGDLHVDGHHTVEDIGVCLGTAFHQAVGDKQGITRFGQAYCPLDEALGLAIVDISGRGFLSFECPLALTMVGAFSGELFPEFLRAFAVQAQITLHLKLISGQNQHHALEAMTKALARALRQAVTLDERQTGIPSTKGSL